MTKTVQLICATTLIAVLLGVFAVLKIRGAVDDQFLVIAGSVFNLALGAFNLAKTDAVHTQVNGRFSAQQEIARKALDVLPGDQVAQILRDVVLPAAAPNANTAQVDSGSPVSPRTDPPGSVTNPPAQTA